MYDDTKTEIKKGKTKRRKKKTKKKLRKIRRALFSFAILSQKFRPVSLAVGQIYGYINQECKSVCPLPL